MARPDPTDKALVKKNVWHVIADDLAAMQYRMSEVEWALFDHWRSLWGAVA